MFSFLNLHNPIIKPMHFTSQLHSHHHTNSISIHLLLNSHPFTNSPFLSTTLLILPSSPIFWSSSSILYSPHFHALSLSCISPPHTNSPSNPDSFLLSYYFFHNFHEILLSTKTRIFYSSILFLHLPSNHHSKWLLISTVVTVSIVLARWLMIWTCLMPRIFLRKILRLFLMSLPPCIRYRSDELMWS